MGERVQDPLGVLLGIYGVKARVVAGAGGDAGAMPAQHASVLDPRTRIPAPKVHLPQTKSSGWHSKPTAFGRTSSRCLSKPGQAIAPARWAWPTSSPPSISRCSITGRTNLAGQIAR